jgi:hypothetical protein
MTFPTFDEISRACLRFHDRGGRIISGTWGDGKSCACPLTALADARGILPTNGLTSSNVQAVLHVDHLEAAEFIYEYDTGGEDITELGARIAKFVDEHNLHIPRAGLDSLDGEEDE